MSYVNPFGTCEDCGTCAIRVEVLDANGIKRLVCRDCRGYYQSKDGENHGDTSATRDEEGQDYRRDPEAACA